MFKDKYIVLSNDDKDQRGAMFSMVHRLADLRRHGVLIVAHDHATKCTVFVLGAGIKIEKYIKKYDKTKFGFGGRLLHYVLTGTDELT